jgi:hypothetical protein
LTLGAVLVGCLVVAGGLAAGSRRAGRTRGIVHPRDELVIEVRSPRPGFVAFSAAATVSSHVRDAMFWWHVEIAQHTSVGLIRTWMHDYDDLPYYTAVKRGVQALATLAEQRIPLQAGRYLVSISVKEDVATMDAQGNITEPVSEHAGQSAWVEIP